MEENLSDSFYVEIKLTEDDIKMGGQEFVDRLITPAIYMLLDRVKNNSGGLTNKSLYLTVSECIES